MSIKLITTLVHRNTSFNFSGFTIVSKLKQLLILSCIVLLFTTCKKEIRTGETSASAIKYCYGGINDKINRIEKTADGGFICSGNTRNGFIYDDGFLMKIDAGGNREWYKTYGGKFNDHLWHVIQTSDGGYLAVGSTQFTDSTFSDWVLKVNSNGDTEWSKSQFQSPLAANLTNVIEAPDHSFYATGSSSENGASLYNIILVKLNQVGQLIYSKSYTDFNNYPPHLIRKTTYEFGTNINIASDGSVLIGGLMSSGGSSFYITKFIKFLMKINASNGVVDYYYPYYNYLNEDNYLTYTRFYNKMIVKVVNLTDGYLLGSNIELPNYKIAMQLLKTNLNGEIIWEKEYAGMGNAMLEDLQLLGDSNLIMIGSSTTASLNYGFPELFQNLKCAFLKIDLSGNVINANYYGSETNANIAQKLSILLNGDYLLAGYNCQSERGYDQFMRIQFDKNGKLKQ